MLFSPGFETSIDQTLSGVDDMAAGVSLTVLHRIQWTADELASIERSCRGLAKMMTAIGQMVKNISSTATLDADGAFADAAQLQANRFAEAVVAAVRLKRGVEGNRDYLEHHRELLHACIDSMLDAMSDVSEGLMELRAIVIARELAIDPRNDEVFDSPESFSASLRSGG